MAETLGSLCDKLTIVKLKQWHSDDSDRLNSLAIQEQQLQNEINEFIYAAVTDQIQIEHLTFASNKVFKKEGNIVANIEGSVGGIVSQLAQVNCELWHEQEKVYEFENIPSEQKNTVVKRLAHLNLKRNMCIDQIDKQLCGFIENRDKSALNTRGEI